MSTAPLRSAINDNLNQNYQRETQIVATLGPSSWSAEGIKQLKEAGVNVFRINCSHLDLEKKPEQLEELVNLVRGIVGQECEILVDLQGPKLRCGRFDKSDNEKTGLVHLDVGQDFIFDSDPTLGDSNRVQLPHPEVLESIEVGHDILLDDGQVHMRVKEKAPDHIVVEVISGEKLSDCKGFNLPNTKLPTSSLTEEDRGWITIMNDRNLDIDYVAQSFVETANDVIDLENLLEIDAKIVPKIERPEALENFAAIIKLVQTFMIARGDLSIETPMADMPMEQKEMIEIAKQLGKNAIVATHTMESMIASMRPTNAEVTDASNAVGRGAWGVMLSAETAVGKHPKTVVEKLAEIIRRREMYEKGSMVSRVRTSFEKAAVEEKALEMDQEAERNPAPAQSDFPVGAIAGRGRGLN
ncbi:pyruvate kinase [Alphaproteobacteria bacterium]|nr:pyruvate kinase [Alphaproteobacteria bacterium]